MVWLSSVKCPNCGAPLDVDRDVSVCPYCYWTGPQSLLCQTDAEGEGWWAYPLAIAALAGLGVLLANDIWLGTSYLPTILETVSGWLDEA